MRRGSARGARSARASAAAPNLWRDWLGASGVPAPLDRFLSARRVDQDAFLQLTRAAAWAPSVLDVCDPAPPPAGGAPLCDRLRRLDPREVLGVAARLAGRDAPPALARRVDAWTARRRAQATWEARCLVHGVPAGFAPAVARWAARHGQTQVEAWLAAQTRRAPLWVRARSPEGARSLRGEGLTVEEVDGALRVSGPRSLATTDAWRRGLIEVQDLASQRCGALAGLEPGQLAWDVCAGRGGKTTQLADALQVGARRGRGAVHATDVDAHKLDALRVRVRRAGLADVVRIHTWDGRAPPAFGPEARRGFDVVLVDAPCSATGTWRRNPDARLRVHPDDVPGFAALQRELVGIGARALRPGGRLVYVTCSWCEAEDEDVVDAVAAEHGLRPVAVERFGPPALDSDTLFAAVLTRP